MDSGPSRKASLRPRRTRANYVESEEENEETEQFRSPSNTRPPPIRRARITEDDQESKITAPATVDTEAVDTSQANQSSSVVPSIASQFGRTSRITEEQLRELSLIYETDPYANLEGRRDIAMRMNLNLLQVSGYFLRQRRRAARERQNNHDGEENAIIASADSEQEQANTLPEKESVHDQPSTVQPRVSGVRISHRIVLRQSPPPNSNVEITPEIESNSVVANGQTSSAVNEEIFIGPNSYAEALRRSLRELQTSNITRDQPSTSALPVDSNGPPGFRDILRRGRQDLAAIRSSTEETEPGTRNLVMNDQPTTSAAPGGFGAARHRMVLLDSSMSFSDDEIVLESESESSEVAVIAQISHVTIEEEDHPVVLNTPVTLNEEIQVTFHSMNTIGAPSPNTVNQAGFSVSPNVAIPQNVLDSFGPEGLKYEDDEEVTDTEEMSFQKVLKKKMVCEICMVHMKQFRCFKCFYSMCKECSDTIRMQHTGKMPCPQCRTKQRKFLQIILPRL